VKSRGKLYVTLGIVVTVVMTAAVSMTYARRSSTAASSAGIPGVGAPFTLTTSDGRAVNERSYPGKWLLVYFGFTMCPDACPTALLSIGGALDALGPLAGNVQPLFITIDPAQDTAAVMAEYMKSFDPRITGLVGTPEQVAAVEKNYRVYDAKRDLGRGTVTIDHSSFIYVVNPHGQITSVLTGDLPKHALADELRGMIR